jgi:hypothetical protein
VHGAFHTFNTSELLLSLHSLAFVVVSSQALFHHVI